LAQHHTRAFRWFDDYELAVDTREQAEEILKDLNRELGRFRLRLNPKKTAISRLPSAAQEDWQQTLRTLRLTNSQSVVRFFDTAFRFREQFPDDPVLMYALGLLFKIQSPSDEVARMALSCITQALLCEPGAAQKAVALLTLWKINGVKLDMKLITNTISKMILAHQAIGFSSDVAWALAFCLDHNLVLDSSAAQVLSVFDDDCNALQALHMGQKGLLPKGFNKKAISSALKNADLDRDHWLIAYESVRHGFLNVCVSAVKSNPLFSDLLNKKVTFYRRALPTYAALIHYGGAPNWVAREWLTLLRKKEPADETTPPRGPVVDLIGKDLARIGQPTITADVGTIELMEAAAEATEAQGTY